MNATTPRLRLVLLITHMDQGGAQEALLRLGRSLRGRGHDVTVVERDFGEGFKRFESARGVPHHEHLLCTVCGRVTEFRDERLERMTTLIAEAHGHMRQRHRLVIYGVCERCRGFGAATSPAASASGTPRDAA